MFKPEKQITKRELEVINHMKEGKTDLQIAEAMGISDKTVYVHRRNVLGKLQLKTTSDLLKILT